MTADQITTVEVDRQDLAIVLGQHGAPSVSAATTDDARRRLARTLGPERPRPTGEASPLVAMLARLVLVVVLMAGAAGVGYLAGMHRGDQLIREELRTRRAVCQLLDQTGADPATAADVEPCRDTPARP